MPGMNSGINVSDPTVVAAFKAALVHQGLIALLIFALLGLAWVTVRTWTPAAGGAGAGTAAGPQGPAVAEPAWRKLLRIGFGLVWIVDGILQAQPKMAVGLPSQVIEPTAASSPRWVQQVVNWGGQLVVSPDAGRRRLGVDPGRDRHLAAGGGAGPLSRLAGLASVGWGLVVWVFGESFGGIFAPGLTWLFGAPGAVLIYAAAGALIALPERAWRTRRLGQARHGRPRAVPDRDGGAAGLAGARVLAGSIARPARHPGRITQSMAGTSPPGFLAAWINAFTAFDEAHGFAVNLFVVAALALTGAAFLSGSRG